MDSSAGWTDFMVAAAGASGALVGLVFVALFNAWVLLVEILR